MSAVPYIGPACGHSACRQNWIDTGEAICCVEDPRSACEKLDFASSRLTPGLRACHYESGAADLRAARAAFAELVAADREYDATVTALREYYRDVAENGYLASKFPDGRALGDAFVAAMIRRDRALDAVGGAQ